MSARGLDFGSGMAGFADLMARGHKDRLDLELSERERAEKIRQFEAQRAMQQRSIDYQYPEEMDVPGFMIDAVSNPEIIPETYNRGVQNAPSPAIRTPPVLNKNGKRIGGFPSNPAAENVANATSGGGGAAGSQRDPSGTAAPGVLSDKTLNNARQLGVEVRPDGRLVAKGRRGQQIIDLYEKILGSQASVFAAGANAGRPQYMQPFVPPGERTPPPRIPKDTRIDQLNARLRAAQIGLASFGKHGAMMDENKPQMDAYRKEIADVTYQLTNLPPAGESAPATYQQPVPLPNIGTGGKEPDEATVQSAAAQWKMGVEQARAILRKRMNSGR